MMFIASALHLPRNAGSLDSNIGLCIVERRLAEFARTWALQGVGERSPFAMGIREQTKRLFSLTPMPFANRLAIWRSSDELDIKQDQCCQSESPRLEPTSPSSKWLSRHP